MLDFMSNHSWKWKHSTVAKEGHFISLRKDQKDHSMEQMAAIMELTNYLQQAGVMPLEHRLNLWSQTMSMFVQRLPW